jgi:NMD protein affecting ribosome stability and mRNA decay
MYLNEKQNLDSMSELCIKCGKRKKVTESLCVECFYELNPPIFGIKQFSITTCPKCNNFLFQGKWMDWGIKKIAEEMLLISIKKNPVYEVDIIIKELFLEKNTYQIVFLLESVFKKKKFSQELIYSAKLKKELCSKCGQKTSGYFEGILQIRSRKNEIISLIKDEILKKQDNYDLKSISITQFGFDVKFRSIQKVRKHVNEFLEKFGGNYDFSTQLFSRNNLTSKDILRTNIRYTAPSFSKGEIIKTDDNFFKVISVKNKVVAQDLFSNQKITLPLDPFKDEYEVIKPQKAQIIKTYPKLSVLHPHTFEETPIKGVIPKIIASKLKIGDTIDVVIAKDELFLIN